MKWMCPKCNAVNRETSGICNNCYTLKPADLPAEYLVDDPKKLLVAGSPIPNGAGFGIRFLARFIDMFVALVLGMAVGIVVGIVLAVLTRFGMLTPEWPTLVNQFSIGGMALGLLGGFLYHSISEGVGSVSIGKVICGLRVVKLDGRPVNMQAAFLRSLAYYVDGLFFGLVALHSMEKSVLRQRYGDVWAKTVVVKRKEFTPIEPRSGLRIAAGIMSGLLAWSSVLVLDMVLKVI
jgi:uncharacterized RDD family membrane protein YckC